MNEELVERIERALEDASERFEKQVDRLVGAMEGTQNDKTEGLLQEILAAIKELSSLLDGM